MALSLGNSNLRSPMSFYPYGQFTATANFLFFGMCAPNQSIFFLENIYRFLIKIFGETFQEKYLERLGKL